MINIYPLPPDLPTNPIFDYLYGPMTSNAPDIQVQRLRPRYALPALFSGRGPRILHVHFFDELTQRQNQHATAARTIAFLALLKTLQARGVRLVWTAHNLEPHELFHPRWGFVVYRNIARWSDAIIAHSHAARAMLESRYGALPQCEVIPLGNYIGRYGPRQERAGSRAALGLPTAGPVLACPGTLRPYKNIEGLIDAFAQLPADQRGTLLIAGAAKSAEYTASLQRRAATVPGVRLDVRYLADDELPTYLAAADVVVLPYHAILTSAMLLCALSYARPVIAPAFGPVRELVREGEQGFLFDPHDPHGLRGALERAITFPDLHTLDEPSFAAALPFDWQTIAMRTANLYRRVMARS